MMPAGMHALDILNIFLAVLIAGTAWRLIMLHFVASDNNSLNHIGKAGLFQF